MAAPPSHDRSEPAYRHPNLAAVGQFAAWYHALVGKNPALAEAALHARGFRSAAELDEYEFRAAAYWQARRRAEGNELWEDLPIHERRRIEMENRRRGGGT